MRAWRTPALVVIVGLLVAGGVVQHRQDDQASTRATTVDVDHLMPVAAPAGAPSTTWYCAGGTATGRADGVAEHTITVANTGTAALQVVVTAFPSEGDTRRRTFELPAGARRDTVLSELVTAPWAAALVEADGGGVAVEHRVRGVDGQAVAPCASTPGGRWYFPAGATRRGAREVLSVFNPFPDDAVVDLTFETDDGGRTPQPYQGLVVPGGKVLPVDITDVVTVRTEVASTVRVRSGRVVVDQVQVWDGQDGQARGVGLTLGAPEPSPVWVFPGGAQLVEGSDVNESYVLFNPGDQPSTALVQVHVEDEATRGGVEPYEVTVRPRQYTIVSLTQDRRVPLGVRRWTEVFTADGPAVVVERVVQAKGSAPERGVSYALGSPLQATRWLVAAAGGPGTAATRVTVVNPSSSDPASVTISAVRGGERGPVEGFSGRSLPPGGQATLDAGGLPEPDGTSLVVEATGPVVVATEVVTTDPTDRSEAMALPVEGTTSLVPAPPLVSTVPALPGTSVPLGDLDVGGSVPLPTVGAAPAGTGSSTTSSSVPPTSAADGSSTTTAPASSSTTTAASSTTAAAPPP
ncbi:MAG: DUF5719 family protein [Acidimicrobiales bacterium]